MKMVHGPVCITTSIIMWCGAPACNALIKIKKKKINGLLMDDHRKPNSNQNNKKQNRNPSKNHVFRKRQPQKPERGDNVLYISTKTNIKAQLERCNKLISNNENEIIIYCLGAAIQRGILLALQLQERHISFNIYTNTLSTELIDDLEPAIDDADYEIQKRFNSALRIRVFRTDLLETAEKKDN